MTAQDDWLPGLDDAEERDETATPRRRRWLLAGVAALATVVALIAVVAELRAPSTAGAAPPTAAASSSPAVGSPAATPAAGRLLLDARLTDPAITGGGQLAPLVVAVRQVQGGVAPARVPNFDSCGADKASLQYLPVEIRLPDSWLSATFDVRATSSTPADLGRLGFFFQAGRASTPCPGGAWPASDSFVASNAGQFRITGYVVLDQAFTPSTPQGRSDVFRTLQLRVSDVRSSGRPVTIGPPTVGALCPGAQNELCAPLG
jgi:hypothetical protein